MAATEGVEIKPETTEQGLSEEAVTKLTTASTLVNEVLKQVLGLAIPGSDILHLCKIGDRLLLNGLSKVYNKKEKGKKVDKGICFPTTLCVNDIICHFSPNEEEEKSEMKLKIGDVVKVEIGAHIDGYPCVAGTTVICSYTSADIYMKNTDEKLINQEENDEDENENKISCLSNKDIIVEKKKVLDMINTNLSKENFNDICTEKYANLLKGVCVVSEAAIRLMRDGNKSTDVIEIMDKAASQFDCANIQGLFSYEMKKHVLEGTKAFPLSKITQQEEKIAPFEFKEGEIYSLSVRVTTGDGRCKEMDTKPMIYRRAVDRKYILKSPLGRQFMSNVESTSPTFPFSLRMSDNRSSKVGVAEAMRHDLLHAYPVLMEKNGDPTATITCTVMILPSGPKRICGIPFLLENSIKATKEVTDEELKTLLATSLSKKKQKKKDKKEEKKESA